MQCEGFIRHYPDGDKVVFYFAKIDEKSKTKDSDDPIAFTYNLPFEIYKFAKDSRVKITIEKVK